MYKKVRHLVQKEIMHKHLSHYHKGITLTPCTVLYYCGRVAEYMHESKTRYTLAERKAIASMERKQEQNTKICKRCELERTKAISSTTTKDV